MGEIKIKGILAKDATTDWKADFEEEVMEYGCGVMWKDQMSNLGEIKGLLRELISEQEYFDYYNIANHVSDYHGKIIDFATKEEYPAKVQEWEKKNPAWFKKSFDEYAAGNQKAVIAFLVEDFKKIPKEAQIHVNQFKFYDKIPSVKNAVAYIDILTKEKLNQQAMINEIKQLLNHNYNLILTGAPGTGKTYLAKQIAQQLIFGEVKKEMTDEEKKQFNEQCGFVQFHPSYDYTDFVEGLRPVDDGYGKVSFERRNGIFKDFCKKALYNDLKKDIPLPLLQGTSFDIVYNSLLNDVKSGKINNYKTPRGINPLKIKDNRLVYREKSSRTECEDNMKLLYEYLLNKEKYDLSDLTKNDYWRMISNLTNGKTKTIDYSEYGWTLQVLLDRAKNVIQNSNSEKPNSEKETLQPSTNKNFVFIIDEINRGEISKIFGELFFSIDPGYRGIKGKVETQYQNLIKEDDDFYEGFFVPENVYIIGTMNDIDRSVESMDFAFRRRFAFAEIKADENVGMLDDLKWKDEAIERMKRLNEAISKTEGLSSAYHIGASYFLKLKNYNGDFNQLWEYHLEGLLREYLRGMQGVEDSMKKLKNAYDNANPSNGQQQ